MTENTGSGAVVTTVPEIPQQTASLSCSLQSRAEYNKGHRGIYKPLFESGQPSAERDGRAEFGTADRTISTCNLKGQGKGQSWRLGREVQPLFGNSSREDNPLVCCK